MNPRSRLGVERLEDRWCPAVTTSLRGGTLTISGSADNGAISIVQDATTPGTFTVDDGSTAVSGGPFTGVTNIRLNLTEADDNVTIDLGGQTLSGGVTANLGDGTNTLTVTNGEIAGRLAVHAGNGDDTVTLGDGTTALTLRNADISLDGGMDSLTVNSGVDVSRALVTAYVNEWTMDQGATAGDVFIRGGSGGNTINVAGGVTGDLVVDSFFRSGSDAGTTLDVSGSVDGNLIFVGSNQDDTLNVTGAVGRSLGAATLDGADTVSISGDVGRNLSLDSGSGDDTMTCDGSVAGRTSISGGAGNDQLTIGSTADLTGRATVNMGSGDDTVTLDDAATISTLRVNGGPGTNTFVGTNTRTGLTLIDSGDASTTSGTETKFGRGAGRSSE